MSEGTRPPPVIPALALAAKATVQRILAEQHLQPHKVKYYLERRDPEFEIKMKEVLMVYQEVMLQNEAAATGGRARPGDHGVH